MHGLEKAIDAFTSSWDHNDSLKVTLTQVQKNQHKS